MQPRAQPIGNAPVKGDPRENRLHVSCPVVPFFSVAVGVAGVAGNDKRADRRVAVERVVSERRLFASAPNTTTTIKLRLWKDCTSKSKSVCPWSRVRQADALASEVVEINSTRWQIHSQAAANRNDGLTDTW
jgi:hypothetical protein